MRYINLKYVDDLTLAEAINLPEKLISMPASKRPLPDLFHARTGHVLPQENSNVFNELEKTINFKKTKLMVFNPCTSIDFSPDFTIDNHDLQVAMR
jgi:hypothetical protein